MAYLMTADEFIKKLKDINDNYKTLYVLGTWGWPATAANKNRAITKQPWNATTARKAMINAASRDTFFFDCGGLIKGILWGWCGDVSKAYGGAGYACNGVPDTASLINLCNHVSTDFSQIIPGELLYMPGNDLAHVGVYIGNGQVIECSPAWENGVQITNLGNIGNKSGHYRVWQKHGQLPYIDYSQIVSEINNASNQKPTSEDIYDGDAVMYTVQRGDNLTKIAKKFSTTVDKLVQLNGIANPNLINVGQVLKIKGTAADNVTTYTVKKGDTLSAIAKKFNTTYLSIAAKNGIINPNIISVGQVLKI